MHNKIKFHEHGDVLRSSYILDTNGLKLLGYNLSQLKYTDSNKIEIKKEKLFELIPSFKNKDRLKKSLDNLKTSTIRNLHKSLLFSVWISAVEEKEDSYIFEFPELLLKYLKPFIATEMVNINLYYYFKLTRYSSLRLYKLFSQYINTTKVYIVNYNDLKNVLLLENKRENNNMNLVKKACDEISEKTDIKIIGINRKMKDKKIETLTFFLKKNKTNETSLIEDNSNNNVLNYSEEEISLVNSIFSLADFSSDIDKLKYKIGKEKLFENIKELKEIGFDKLKKCYELYVERLRKDRQNGFENKNIMSCGRFFTDDYKIYLDNLKISLQQEKSVFDMINEQMENK